MFVPAVHRPRPPSVGECKGERWPFVCLEWNTGPGKGMPGLWDLGFWGVWDFCLFQGVLLYIVRHGCAMEKM